MKGSNYIITNSNLLLLLILYIIALIHYNMIPCLLSYSIQRSFYNHNYRICRSTTFLTRTASIKNYYYSHLSSKSITTHNDDDNIIKKNRLFIYSTINSRFKLTSQQNDEYNDISILSSHEVSSEVETTLLSTNMHIEQRKIEVVNDDNVQNNKNQYNETNWMEHPDLNIIIPFQSWIVPIDHNGAIQKILNSTITKEYLANNYDILQHIHTRLKLIRDYNISSEYNINHNTNVNDIDSNVLYKLILLHPNTPNVKDLPENIQDFLNKLNVYDGPIYDVTYSAKEFTSSYILTKLLPPHLHPVPTSFETVGHIAHLNLKNKHTPYAKLIGNVLYETLSSTHIKTVIHKVGDVSGPYRTYEYEMLAGEDNMNVNVIENGISLQFNLSDVYWCSRLSEERKRLLYNEIQHNDVIADPFCGVGAMCIQAAKYKNCIILANDWNQNAIKSLQYNVQQNNVQNQFHSITSIDAYEFLIDLGLTTYNNNQKVYTPRIRNNNNTKRKKRGTGRRPTRQQEQEQNNDNTNYYHRLPDHVILNFPLESTKFLGALRWWPVPEQEQEDGITEMAVIPRIHVYTFAQSNDETTSAEIEAVNLVADNLLPSSSSHQQSESCIEEDNNDNDDKMNNNLMKDTTSCNSTSIYPNRLNELNNEYNCKVSVHHVRDVAPGKVVMCVSFSVTPKLIKHMRGDYQ